MAASLTGARHLRMENINKVEFTNDLIQETLLYMWNEQEHYDPKRGTVKQWGRKMMKSMYWTMVDIYRLQNRD